MLPIVFGLLTSLCFAIASLLAQRGYFAAAAPWGAWVTIAVNALFLLAAHFILYSDTRLFAVDNLIFIAVGLFVPGVTRVLSFRGIRAMGSSVTSTIVNTTPMFSTVLAILILEERPAPLVVLGVALTVGGLVTVSWGGEKTSYKKSELIYPFLCALLFSMKDVAVRWGLGGGGGQPILAAGIAALTSTIEIFLITRYVQGEKFILPPAPVARWFMGSGIFTGASFLFMYLAYSLERVSIVAPLVNSYTVFVSILTPFMARRIETVTARKLAGAALVVAGIFAVSLGKD
ncbi:MAG TPA: DMT family transporter [Candidatus Limnocylindrales bacterium]|nr:DMT family transporter [Candidatus Limnocylindrales bacterium]